MINIEQFINRVQSFDLRGQKDFVMSMKEAKALHTDISKLLLQLNELKNLYAQNVQKNEVIEVQIKGREFK
jgi:hypothetical protein